MVQRVADMKESTGQVTACSLLQEKMLRLMPVEGDYASTLLHGFTAIRRDRAGPVAEPTAEPVMGLIVQGVKRFKSSGRFGSCAEGECFIEGKGVTESSCIVSASSFHPYLCLSLSVDPGLLSMLTKQAVVCTPCADEAAPVVAKADSGVTDAFFRLLKLLSCPQHFLYLSPLIVREIHYRMLIGPLGGWMRVTQNTLRSKDAVS